MSESSASNFPPRRFKRSEGPTLDLQQGDSRSASRPKVSRPLASHFQAQHFPLAADEEMDAALWYACAGPQHILPPVDTVVAYFPQGHIEQVASFSNPDVEGHIPRYDLPAAIPCTLNDIRLSADPETDEVYATLTLCPVSDPMDESSGSMEPPPRPEQKTRTFTKILTVSDTSTHGGFSIPRRGAEECFPPLDKSHDNPAQELVAKDLHGHEWKFKHLFRGQPKRHLLTTGWSVFVSQKRLVAGDAVLFLRGEDEQLRIAVRRAPRQQKLQSIMVTTPTMAIGVLEAAAHAASEKSRFSLIYNPRSCPSQFVIPYSKYLNALKNNFAVGQRVRSEFCGTDSKYLNAITYHSTVGQRTRSRCDSEDSADCRYTGTIVGIDDYDPARWPGSIWRSLQVNWDESCERQERISPWEVAPFTARTNLPPQDRTRKRVKPQPSQYGTGPSFGPHMRRLDPPPTREMFGGLHVTVLQDLRGINVTEQRQQEPANYVMQQQFRPYNDNHSARGTALQPSSPRPSGLQPFVKSEPFRDPDLGFSPPAAKDQVRTESLNLLSPNVGSAQHSIVQHPIRPPFLDPSGADWLSSFRQHRESGSSPILSSPDCTALSMGSLAPQEPGHPSTPKPTFWEKQVSTATPVQGEHRCRIFGVSLDRPASPVNCTQASGTQVASNCDDVGNQNYSPCLENLGSLQLEGHEEDQATQKCEGWSQALVHEQGAVGRTTDTTNFNCYGDLVQEVKKMCID